MGNLFCKTYCWQKQVEKPLQLNIDHLESGIVVAKIVKLKMLHSVTEGAMLVFLV